MNYSSFTDEYRAPTLLFNGHLQTIYPALFRKLSPPPVKKATLHLEDGDFLDYDHWQNGSDKLVIISHGLEGDSRRPYVLGMAHAYYREGYDVVAWNYRGCSGRVNKKPRLYHSGATDDLDAVVNAFKDKFNKIILIGFSLGGNLTLKYLGENRDYSKISTAVTFSVPLDLRSGSLALSSPKNLIYEKRFLRALRKKVKLKSEQFPEVFDVSLLQKIRTLYQFDDRITAPIHGFANADDYYERCSSRFFLDNIRVPTLIVNALNDPLLTDVTLNPKLGSDNPNLTYELTRKGGHCGFGYLAGNKEYWSERRALQFTNQ
jgi:predicted alpha/beta-fold hydrolase